MKTPLFILALGLCLTMAAQTADELVAEAVELAATNPENFKIKKDLEKALGQEPGHEEALHQLALYHIARNTDVYALEPLNTLIMLYPAKAEYYWLRAKVNIRKNALKEELMQASKDLDSAEDKGYSHPDQLAKARAYIVEFFKR